MSQSRYSGAKKAKNDIFKIRNEAILQELASKKMSFKREQIDTGYRRIKIIKQEGFAKIGEYYHAVLDKENNVYTIIYDIKNMGKQIKRENAIPVKRYIVEYSIRHVNSRDEFIKDFVMEVDAINEIDLKDRLKEIHEHAWHDLKEEYHFSSTTENYSKYPSYHWFVQNKQPFNCCDKYFKKYVTIIPEN